MASLNANAEIWWEQRWCGALAEPQPRTARAARASITLWLQRPVAASKGVGVGRVKETPPNLARQVLHLACANGSKKWLLQCPPLNGSLPKWRARVSVTDGHALVSGGLWTDGETGQHTGGNGGELEERAGKAGKVHQKLSSSLLLFRKAQPHAEVIKTRCISHFQGHTCFLCRPEGNTGGLVPLEAGEVKAGTQEPLGMAKLQPQYSSRMWEQSVCVCGCARTRVCVCDTERSPLVHHDLYSWEGFPNFCSFPFSVRAWRRSQAVAGAAH